MRLNELQEEDFEVLRGPLESGRQSPGSLGAILLLAPFLQALMIGLISYLGGKGEYESLFPYKNEIIMSFLIYTGLITICSVLYSFKFIWMRNESFQYLLSIVVSQNIFGISCYLIALILIGHGKEVSTISMVIFTVFTLLMGILVLLFTYRRFIRLLSNGAYRKGSKKDKIRLGVEKGVMSHKPTIYVLSVGLVFIIQFLFRNIGVAEYDFIIMITLGLGLFYTVLFMLPEQLVIYYCKRRFKSFRFDEDGNLNPLEYKQHRNDAELSKKRRKQMRQIHKRKS